MNKWKDKMQLLHSAQEARNSVLETKWHELKTSQENLKSQLQETRDRNCILEMNCHDLIARHENLKMQVQKMRLDVQVWITVSHIQCNNTFGTHLISSSNTDWQVVKDTCFEFLSYMSFSGTNMWGRMWLLSKG